VDNERSDHRTVVDLELETLSAEPGWSSLDNTQRAERLKKAMVDRAPGQLKQDWRDISVQSYEWLMTHRAPAKKPKK